MKAKRTSVSPLWLFLLSSLAGRNQLLSIRFRSRKTMTKPLRADGDDNEPIRILPMAGRKV